MQKEDITIVAQLLTGIKDAIDKLEAAQKDKDAEKLSTAKKEILHFQKQISNLI